MTSAVQKFIEYLKCRDMDEVACMWNKAYRSLVVYDVKESLRNDIGNQILNIRKENQLTQEEFGKLFHVTRQTVLNWENGKSYPELQITENA